MELVLVSLKFIQNKLIYTRKKMVLYFSWQEYVRLVYKKGLFWGFFFTSKIILFLFFLFHGHLVYSKIPSNAIYMALFFLGDIIQTYFLLLSLFQVNQWSDYNHKNNSYKCAYIPFIKKYNNTKKHDH